MQPALHFDVHGVQGPAILMVHGMLSSRSQWIPNVDAFTAAGYRPVVVELLGHGRSPSPDEPSRYEPAHYLREFEAIRESLGLERWYVIGQSLGAGLTLRYAVEHPGRVIAQVFTNSNSALAGGDFEARVRSGTQRTFAEVERRGRAVLEENRLNPAKSRSIPEHIRSAMAADFELHDPRGFAMTGLHTTVHSPVRDVIGRNTVPVLLVAGMREEHFRPAVEWARANIPLLEVCETGAGHAVNIQAADEFNSAVVEFFGRHS
jgi:2-succinyl-6-hydroxy-2,4-cyclohexadiene-1-carboxylate synthase